MTIMTGLTHGEIAIALYAAEAVTGVSLSADAIEALHTLGVSRLGGAGQLRRLTEEMRRWDHLVLDGLLTADEHEILVRHRWPDEVRFDWCFGLAARYEPSMS
jgi:hypothetical protein